MDLYDDARKVTDEILGEGSYAAINRSSPDPKVQAAIRRGPVGRRLQYTLAVKRDGVFLCRLDAANALHAATNIERLMDKHPDAELDIKIIKNDLGEKHD